MITASAQAQSKAELYGRLPAMTSAELSPDGAYIAALEDLEGQTGLVIYPTDTSTGERPRLYKPEGVKIRSAEWANNDRILVRMSYSYALPGTPNVYELWRFASVSKDLKKVTPLFTNDSGFQATTDGGKIIHLLPEDDKHVLMARYDPFEFAADVTTSIGMSRLDNDDQEDFGGYSVYRVNVINGSVRVFAKSTNETADWVADAQGRVRLRLDYPETRRALDEDEGDKDLGIDADGRRYMILNEGGRRIARLPLMSGVTPDTALRYIGFGDDPNIVLAFGRVDSEFLGLHEVNLSERRYIGPRFVPDDFDISSVVRDPFTNSILGVTYTADRRRILYFDEDLESTYDRVSGAFQGMGVSLLSYARDKSKFTLRATPPGKPSTFYVFDAARNKMSALGFSYPELRKSPLGEVQKFDYTASDGLFIPGYLTLPVSGAKADLPLIVMPHGGPAARDTMNFDYWAQFYSALGYAVYQPNFRGSTGYGDAFRRAGWAEWAGKMQDDITEGVEKLIADGVASPNRICIVGASYGGYAALIGATMTPELYTCAISVNGLSDLEMMYNEYVTKGVGSRSEFMRELQRQVGDRISSGMTLADRSPVNHAEAVQAPLLLIHGKDDSVVSADQSRLMVRALKAAGKPHSYIELEGEDHWLSSAETRIRMLKETEAFLREHLGPGAE